MKPSPSIFRHLSPDFIKTHAIPSNIAYGRAISDRGAVHIIESTDTRVEAWVGGLDGKVVEGGGSKRRVSFSSAAGELQWRCTGNPTDLQTTHRLCHRATETRDGVMAPFPVPIQHSSTHLSVIPSNEGIQRYVFLCIGFSRPAWRDKYARMTVSTDITGKN